MDFTHPISINIIADLFISIILTNMIQRRRKPENTQENNEERPSLKNRKEALRTGNRFTYQLENLNTEKDDDESKGGRTKYYHDYSISDK